MTPGGILLVDDDGDLLELISLRLRSAGYVVHTARSGAQALGLLSQLRPQLLITDLRMDGMDGLALFERAHALLPTLPVIILTAHGTIPDAVAATRRGVFAFLTKPFDSMDLLAQAAQALALGGSAGAGEAWREGVVTRSLVMEELLRRAKLVAVSEASILLQGASGTGKEVLAQAIHRASTRCDGPFVAINCAALPEQLLESELFGHVRGAFTGAVQAQKGLFQEARGGTLFLDEIGDMPLALQAKLLRVLQEREVRPLGATTHSPIDVRVLSATHVDLAESMAAGRFRQDLYYRLKVVCLELPSLAARREDIPLLCSHFLSRLALRYRKPARSFAPEALALLANAAWPGNVRQLLNVVEQAVALSTTALMPASLIEQSLQPDARAVASLDEARRAFERDYLVSLLQATGGNVSQAARLAQRNRTEFYKLLQRHELSPATFKRDGV